MWASLSWAADDSTVSSTSEDSIEIESSNYGGIWGFSAIACPAGSEVTEEIQKELQNSEMFGQFIFQDNQVIFRVLMNNCALDQKYNYTQTDNTFSPIHPPTEITRKCPGKDRETFPTNEGMPLNNLQFRTTPQGILELIIYGEGRVRSCTSNQPETVIFRRIPIG